MSEFADHKYVDQLGARNKLLRLVWSITYYLFFRFTPRVGFNPWRISLLKLFGAQIGKGSKVAASAKIWAPWNLVMGEFSVLGDQVECYTMAKITLGSKVAVSQRTFLCTGSHVISSLTRELITKPISIQDHVWVAAEAYIGPGVTIKRGAVVGARAVVAKDVDEWQILVGNPAQVVGLRKLKEEL